MTTYGADTFTRANSTTTMGTAETGGAWTALVGTWGIINNAAYRPGGTDDAHNRASLSIGQSNVTVSADVGLSGTSNRAYAGLLLRYADANNYLMVYLAKSTAVPNNIIINQRAAGADSTLAEVTSAGLVNGTIYDLRVVIAGSTIAVHVDDVQRIAATAFNAGLTGQSYGLTIVKGSADFDNGNSFWDNFLITDNEPDALIPRLNPSLNANIYRM